MSNKYLIVIAGPTASGKTNIAIEVAEIFETEIISADSRQFFREMVIGTAAPTPVQMARVMHHFVGHKSVKEYYNASMFETDVLGRFKKLFADRSVVVMTGGSGMYIDAVCHGIDDFPTVSHPVRMKMKALYHKEGHAGILRKLEEIDPDYYMKVDQNNPKRILKALEIYEMTGKPYTSFLTGQSKARNFKVLKMALNVDRSDLYKRINDRVDKMIENGLVEEVRALYPYRDMNPLNTVGYKEIFRHLDNEISLEEAVDLIKRHTRQYARRQLTWFRKDREIHWFSDNEKDKLIGFIQDNIKTYESY